MLKRFFSVLLAIVALTPLIYGQRLAVLSDIHVTPGNENETRLRRAVAEINAGNFDAVIVNGDLTNEGSDLELSNVKAILDSIVHPLYVLPGNHENTWSQSATKTFVDLWGNDRFTIDMDSLFVVGINCGPFMKMGDGHIKQEDLHWLDTTLARASADGKRVLSFNHYPLLDDLDNMPDYIDVLQKYPVLAHINGHYHRWRFYYAGGNNEVKTIPCMMTRALDMRDGTYGYAVIEVKPNSVTVYNKDVDGALTEKCIMFTTENRAPYVRPQKRLPRVPQGIELNEVWADSASVFTRLGFDDENIYFGTSTGLAKALGRADGKIRWSVQTGASLFSRPVALPRGRVAFPMHDGILILNAADGSEVAKVPSAEGPYVADGLVTEDKYLQGAYRRMECRDPESGELKWTYDSIFNYCQAAPAVDGKDLVFGAWDTNLRCLDVNTGKLRWVWNNGKSANMLGPGNVVPVISGKRVYVVAPDRFMTAIDRRTGRQLWRDNSHKYRESLGVSADGKRVYAKTMDGELVAVDATVPEFREIFSVDMGLGYEHAPCIVAEKDGLVISGSRRGVISIIDPAKAELVASLPVGTSEINGIDIDPVSGDIYVSLIEGTIFRLKL